MNDCVSLTVVAGPCPAYDMSEGSIPAFDCEPEKNVDVPEVPFALFVGKGDGGLKLPLPLERLLAGVDGTVGYGDDGGILVCGTCAPAMPLLLAERSNPVLCTKRGLTGVWPVVLCRAIPMFVVLVEPCPCVISGEKETGV